MRSIKKLKSTGKAVAGSALLVGATLTGAASLAAAQDSGSMDLGDYPMPFVDEDGEVDSTIVVGDQAKTADVVGAINVAGSLGNAAFMEEEVSVDVSNAVSSWTAENGMTLNRDNDNLFLLDATDTQENDFDEDDLDSLQTTTVQSDDNEEVELEFEAMVGNQAQEFSDEGDYDDPVLHVNNPSNPSVDSNYLIQASVEFDETMDFSETDSDSSDIDDNADEVLEDGTELELFGSTYTYSDESTDDELVLYGSSESFEVNTGEETTTTVDGNEHTFSVDYVTEETPREATIVVDGQTQSVEEGDSVTVSQQEVRVTDIYRTGADGAGRVEFSIGSQEVTITQNDVEVDGDTVDGVDVEVTSNPNTGGTFSAVEEIKFAFGSTDSNEDFIEAGQSYEDPVFGALEFHYGGLNPDAATEDGAAEMFQVEADEEGTAEVMFTAEGGDQVTQTFADDDASSSTALMADDDEKIATYEGQELKEDDYVVINQNEDSGLYEITSLDVGLENANNGNGDVQVTLRDVASGDSMTIEEDDLEDADLDSQNPDSYTLTSESVDGMDHDITFNENGGSDETVSFMGSDTDDGLAVYPSVYTQEDGAVAFTEETTIPGDNIGNVAQSEQKSSQETVQSNSETLFDFDNLQSEWVEVTFLNGGSSQGTFNITVDSNGDAQVNLSNSQFAFDQVEVNPANTDLGSVNNLNFYYNHSSGSFTDSASYNGDRTFSSFSESGDGGSTFDVRLPSTTSSNEYEVTFDDSDSGTVVGDRQLRLEVVSVSTGSDEATVRPAQGTTGLADAAVHYVQPEDDEDTEHGYSVDTDVSDGAGNSLLDVYYTNSNGIADLQGDLDDEDAKVGYNLYGTYAMNNEDADESEDFDLHVPGAQATAGMAVTGMDGSISASGGGSGSAMTMTPTGWPDAAALDTEVSGSDRDQNMILVGGPAVNTLTEELAQDNKTWTGDQYEEDTWVLDLVEGFSEDTHALVVAGHSADDTRAASSFISNYADNADELAGETTVSMTTSASQ